MRRLLLACSVLVAPAVAQAQAPDLSKYHRTFDQNFGANGIQAGPPGSGTPWETSVSYGSLATGNNGVVNPTAPGQPGSLFSKAGCALNMAITLENSPYLDTSAGFTQQYGYFEASIKQASSSSGGVWNAFWMTPPAGSWPPEIDILEGDGTDAEFTNHGGDVNTPVNNTNIYNRPDLSSGFHTYGLMWTPTTLTWYLDGQAVYSAPTASNEQQPMMLILSAYNKGAADPSAMQVAWVRAYSNDPAVPAVQPATGGACPETGGAPQNALLAAAAAAGYSITTPLPQAAAEAATIGAQAAAQATAPPHASSDTNCDVGTASGVAQFTVSVDGKQVGGVRSVGGLSLADIETAFGSGQHSITVNPVSADASAPASVTSCSAPMTLPAAAAVSGETESPEDFASSALHHPPRWHHRHEHAGSR